jgi:spore coat protein CotH
VGGLFLLLVVLVIGLWMALQSPEVQRRIFEWSLSWDPPTAEALSAERAPTPRFAGPVGDATTVQSVDEIFRPDRVWNVRIRFTRAQWERIQALRVEPLKNWMSREDGTLRLSNPKASRNGLAGVLGFDFPWSTGDVEFGGMLFTNTALRFKGNGTYLDALRSYRKPFKLDFAKGNPGRNLGGRTEFNLGNLVADRSCLSDTLGYEFFRNAGVPSPRTGFARVFLDLEGRETNRLLGLYLLVENPDGEWARERFAATNVALFKPVTLELFSDLGSNWSAYQRIYDPKTRLSEADQARVMGFARLVSHADDSEFARQVGAWVDVEEFCRFLACEVLLSNYDGILSNGQNFLMYLDPRTQRFGFIPWDLDHAWGEFPFLGTADQRERASIWTPWIGKNRFLERMLQVDAVRTLYRQELERLLSTQFDPERLGRRIDELAGTLRPLIEEWSEDRLARFEVAVSDQWTDGPRDGNPTGGDRPVWQLKRFIRNRAENVRAQLDGREEGGVITRPTW